MNKILKNTLFTLFVLTILTVAGFAYYFSTKLDSNTAKKLAIAEVRGKFIPYGNFTDTNKFDQGEPEVILTKDDVENPVYTMILSDGIYQSTPKNKNDSRRFTLFSMYYHRESALNAAYKITGYKSVGIASISIGDLRKEVSQHDLSVEQRPLDIIRGTPLTPTEITSASRASTIISILNQKQEVSTTLDYQTNCIYQKIGKPLTKIPVPLSVSPFGFFYQSSEHYILTKADYDQYDQPCLDEMRQVFADTLGSDLASDPSVAGYLISPFQLPAPCVGFGCASLISP